MHNIPEEAVKKLDLTVLERLAEYAEQYDQPDDNGPFPDIQDAMVTVGDLRQARKLLSILSALEPSAARELALEEGDLNARLKAKGMYSIDEMMGGLPLDKWRVHSGMTDLKFFGEWLERKAREYLIMKAAYDVGRKDEGDDLYEWVLAHYGAFHDVLVNFRAALSSPDHADAGKVEEVKLPTERVCIPDPHNTDARIVGFRIREGDDAWGETGLSEPIFWLNKLLTADAGKVEGDGNRETLWKSAARDFGSYLALNGTPYAIDYWNECFGPLFSAPAVAGNVEGDGWLPIESAPKDGTAILAVHPHGQVDFFHWQSRGPHIGWRDSFITVYPDEAGPKIWMPIPPLPSAPASEGAE